jgi:hypothetical protein
MTLTDEAFELLLKEGFTAEYGAREMDRVIAQQLKPLLMREILFGSLKQGGHAFFGESMFSLVPNASKLALIHLAKAMERIEGRFIDCQFETPLFKSMGGRHITYEEYMKRLK